MSVEEYINKNYNKLYQIANRINKDGEDLLHIVILNVLERKNDKSIIDAVKNNLLSYYIYKGMLYQTYTNSSIFNKNYKNGVINEYVDINDVETIDDVEYNFEIDIKKEKILKILDDKNIFTWYERKLFRLFYIYEEEIDIISEKSAEEMKKIRNMSYRKLAKETKIHYVSIYKTLNKTIIKIKKIIENDGKI